MVKHVELGRKLIQKTILILCRRTGRDLRKGSSPCFPRRDSPGGWGQLSSVPSQPHLRTNYDDDGGR